MATYKGQMIEWERKEHSRLPRQLKAVKKLSMHEILADNTYTNPRKPRKCLTNFYLPILPQTLQKEGHNFPTY